MNTNKKTPNIKHQTPEKHQTPNLKTPGRTVLAFDAWCFSGAWCLVFGVFLLVFGVCGAEPLQIDLATILPRGLGQDFVLRKLEQDWGKASGGQVILRHSPGARRDGESGIVKKLRSRNYQAAVLSATGLSDIEPDVAALQNMPLVFQSWDEVDFVREKIRGELEDKLKAKGYVTLFWADTGWVNFFSVRKASTPAEFKRMKLFTWAGDSRQVEIMKSLGYHPIALETEDIYSSFASGMIEAAPLTPTFALGLRIPTETKASHVLDINWAPIVGAGIVRKDTWDKIPADLQPKLLALSVAAGAELRAEGRKFNADAMKTLAKGPKTEVIEPIPEEKAQWQELAKDLGPKVKGNIVPAAIYDEVQSLLTQYRAGKKS
ncbi:MAG: C4-dicarboxylate ABC transporter substrate-binding protein [Verrucomicrobia bacterium]|nr:MAG: C4-dicarboxylate ABC transporter substrate-binding protein [Verrucomicrobiota bacterium]